MSSKKNDKINSISGLETRVKLLIRNGMSAQQIINHVNPLCNPKDVPDHLVEEIVGDVIEEYPNYNLIQKIMRSKIVEDISSSDKLLYLIDNQKKNISTIAADKLNGLFTKTFTFSDRIYTAIQDYRPNDHKQLIRDNPEAPWIFNKYSPPEWLLDTFFSRGKIKVDKVDKVPKKYEVFLKHLVNDDELSYEYILDWLSTAVTSKNHCMLCTIGAKGIGKGVLGSIMRKVVGETNYYYTGNKLLKTNFNSQIQNKKIVYIDEISVTNTQEEDCLKVLINDFIEIEQKGVDAKYVRNYANIYLSSNNLDSIRISGDNRRFSIVNLTSKKLAEVMSGKEIDELLQDDELAYDFARYLYHRDVDSGKMLKVFESDRTEEVRIGALKDWERYIIFEYGLEHAGESIPFTDIINHIKDEQGLLTHLSLSRLEKLIDNFPEYVTKTNKKVKVDKGFKRFFVANFLEREVENE